MIGEILPPSVHWAHSFADRDDSPLFPEEQAAVARAVPQRRAEFTTVRACAREALAELGIAPVPLLPGERRAPRWPDGVVGAITHCAGYRAAAVARSEDVVTLGIDAETNAALPAGVLDIIACPEDLAALSELPAGSRTNWDRILFSAKESVYKAWFPVMREWLDFGEAIVIIRPDGTFTAQILKPGATVLDRSLDRLSGRWIGTARLVATAIVVER